MAIKVPAGYLTIAEAQRLSAIEAPVLRRLARDEVVDAMKIGPYWCIQEDSLKSYRQNYLPNRPGPVPKPATKPPPWKG